MALSATNSSRGKYSVYQDSKYQYLDHHRRSYRYPRGNYAIYDNHPCEQNLHLILIPQKISELLMIVCLVYTYFQISYISRSLKIFLHVVNSSLIELILSEILLSFHKFRKKFTMYQFLLLFNGLNQTI
jgi:hypothetical protein